jgi:hypothetical protein
MNVSVSSVSSCVSFRLPVSWTILYLSKTSSLLRAFPPCYRGDDAGLALQEWSRNHGSREQFQSEGTVGAWTRSAAVLCCGSGIPRPCNRWELRIAREADGAGDENDDGSGDAAAAAAGTGNEAHALSATQSWRKWQLEQETQETRREEEEEEEEEDSTKVGFIQLWREVEEKENSLCVLTEKRHKCPPVKVVFTPEPFLLLTAPFARA